MDILLEIPGLLEDLDRSLACAPDQTQQPSSLREQLHRTCDLCDTQLRTWCTSSGATSLTFAERLISRKTSQISAPSPEDFAMAHLSMIYWATCSLLYQIMRHSGIPVDEQSNPWLYCHKILLMVPFFQRPDMGAIFINFVGFPIGVVISFLARQQDHADSHFEDLRRLLKGIFLNQHRGSQLRAFFETWPWQNTGEPRVVMDRVKAPIK